MKDYLLKFLATAAPENGAGQDALEWALRNNLLKLTYDLDADVRQAMVQYDVIFESYHTMLRASSIDQFITRIAA